MHFVFCFVLLSPLRFSLAPHLKGVEKSPLQWGCCEVKRITVQKGLRTCLAQRTACTLLLMIRNHLRLVQTCIHGSVLQISICFIVSNAHLSLKYSLSLTLAPQLQLKLLWGREGDVCRDNAFYLYTICNSTCFFTLMKWLVIVCEWL